MEQKVQLKREEVIDGATSLENIYPVTNTASVVAKNSEMLDITLDRILNIVNGKMTRIVNSINGRTGVVVLTADDVGLGNVDNVSYNDIKKWVLDQLNDLLGSRHLILLDKLSNISKYLSDEYLYCAFYACENDVAGTGSSTTDESNISCIGYIYKNEDNDITYVTKPINTIYKADDSVLYNEGTHIGGNIGVNVHTFAQQGSTEEDDRDILVIKENETTSTKSKYNSGLYVDTDKLATNIDLMTASQSSEAIASDKLYNISGMQVFKHRPSGDNTAVVNDKLNSPLGFEDYDINDKDNSTGNGLAIVTDASLCTMSSQMYGEGVNARSAQSRNNVSSNKIENWAIRGEGNIQTRYTGTESPETKFHKTDWSCIGVNLSKRFKNPSPSAGDSKYRAINISGLRIDNPRNGVKSSTMRNDLDVEWSGQVDGLNTDLLDHSVPCNTQDATDITKYGSNMSGGLSVNVGKFLEIDADYEKEKTKVDTYYSEGKVNVRRGTGLSEGYTFEKLTEEPKDWKTNWFKYYWCENPGLYDEKQIESFYPVQKTTSNNVKNTFCLYDIEGLCKFPYSPSLLNFENVYNTDTLNGEKILEINDDNTTGKSNIGISIVAMKFVFDMDGLSEEEKEYYSKWYNQWYFHTALSIDENNTITWTDESIKNIFKTEEDSFPFIELKYLVSENGVDTTKVLKLFENCDAFDNITLVDVLDGFKPYKYDKDNANKFTPITDTEELYKWWNANYSNLAILTTYNTGFDRISKANTPPKPSSAIMRSVIRASDGAMYFDKTYPSFVSYIPGATAIPVIPSRKSVAYNNIPFQTSDGTIYTSYDSFESIPKQFVQNSINNHKGYYDPETKLFYKTYKRIVDQDSYSDPLTPEDGYLYYDMSCNIMENFDYIANELNKSTAFTNRCRSFVGDHSDLSIYDYDNDKYTVYKIMGSNEYISDIDDILDSCCGRGAHSKYSEDTILETYKRINYIYQCVFSKNKLKSVTAVESIPAECGFFEFEDYYSTLNMLNKKFINAISNVQLTLYTEQAGSRYSETIYSKYFYVKYKYININSGSYIQSYYKCTLSGDTGVGIDEYCINYIPITNETKIKPSTSYDTDTDSTSFTNPIFIAYDDTHVQEDAEQYFVSLDRYYVAPEFTPDIFYNKKERSNNRLEVAIGAHTSIDCDYESSISYTEDGQLTAIKEYKPGMYYRTNQLLSHRSSKSLWIATNNFSRYGYTSTNNPENDALITYNGKGIQLLSKISYDSLTNSSSKQTVASVDSLLGKSGNYAGTFFYIPKTLIRVKRDETTTTEMYKYGNYSGRVYFISGNINFEQLYFVANIAKTDLINIQQVFYRMIDSHVDNSIVRIDDGRQYETAVKLIDVVTPDPMIGNIYNNEKPYLIPRGTVIDPKNCSYTYADGTTTPDLFNFTRTGKTKKITDYKYMVLDSFVILYLPLTTDGSTKLTEASMATQLNDLCSRLSSYIANGKIMAIDTSVSNTI